MSGTVAESPEPGQIRSQAAQYRREHPGFAQWASGRGVIAHTDHTQVRVYEMAERLAQRGDLPDPDHAYRLLAAADRITSATMWLVVHMTYAHNVYLDGRELGAEDFKTDPQGHTGGALNMVPAYVGHLAANALTGITRSWLMGQGHCVAAIDAANVLVGNMTPAHEVRYELSDLGLTRLVRDFYSFVIAPEGRPESPLGSHVNAHTAGGMMEGGYLGFAELQYVHMPLPGERLVVFLSDGAFEEQRGSDWIPRWWRAEDCGLVTPLMIANGRRIDQRTSMAMKGGIDWFRDHLRLNGFTPLDIDGRDPAAYAWAILEMEDSLQAAADAVRSGKAAYPVPIFHGVAGTEKGYGFPGAGTNRAHNLPLGGNPHRDAAARAEFNEGARRLWVATGEIAEAVGRLNHHAEQGRPRERDHPLAHRMMRTPELPEPPWREGREAASPMEGVDRYFVDILVANPALRPRVGNPDEMRSNRMNRTLDTLKHRVTAPEPGVAEAVDGCVITALNEEAVVCAALANKGGINLVASYEAFAVKMLGAIRQELIFARHLHDAGREPGWLGVPVIATSHTWENGKNEQSHQDPTFAEALMGEMTDVARVAFPADWNSALAALEAVYASRGQIWGLVIPKQPVPNYVNAAQARQLIQYGAVRLRGEGSEEERVQLVATGAYQLGQALKASDRLNNNGISHSLVYMQEPGRFRVARDEREEAVLTPVEVVDELFPSFVDTRVFLTHVRPEVHAGTVWPLLSDPVLSPVLGYINHGGTLDENGMLFANRCTWAHALSAVAGAYSELPDELLTTDEMAAVAGQGDPAALFDQD